MLIGYSVSLNLSHQLKVVFLKFFKKFLNNLSNHDLLEKS